MRDTFISLSEALAKQRLVLTKPKIRSERASIFNDLYPYYEKSYKKNTWLSYIAWLKTNRFKHSSQKVEEFKRTPAYFKIIDVKSLCSFWLGFMKTEDLYYLVSIAKDMDKRGQNFNKWLFYSIKDKSVV